MVLAISEIRSWLRSHQKRMRFDDGIPSMSSIADRAGISRQTLYVVLNGDRSEFGEVAQIRLSKVISQISSEPSYHHSKLSRIDFSSGVPKIRFGM